MHEKDPVDRLLDSSLSSYGDRSPDSGLAERILARISWEQRAPETASKRRNKLLLWAALPAAACVLLILFMGKPSGTPAIHPSPHPPPVAAEAPKGQDLKITAPAKAPTVSAHRTTARAGVAVDASAARPKRDVFPLPQPLSPEEQALYAFATQVPERQRQAVMAAQRIDDGPINIAAISIQPLETPDTGKN